MILETRYDALVDTVELLYNEGNLRGALGLLATERDGLEAWTAELAHMEACLLGASGEADAALQTLLDASASGSWWDPSILTDDDDLAALQDRLEFKQLVEVSRGRIAEDPAPALVELPVIPLAGVVVALHGAGQGAAHARRDWTGVLPLGYALVCVESSQRMSPKYRTWPDRENAIGDITRALGELPDELTGVPIIAAGFSAGGRAALDWALTPRPAQPAGVLLMAPALRELPAAATAKLSPATIWIGTDDDLLEVVGDAEKRLTSFGCTIERVPGLAHTFPADFAGRLKETLRTAGE
jgi:dienelactone hydrolase